MATTGAIYEAGTGGKLRKRPLRRPTSTPYDRPLSAARGLRVLPGSAVEKKNFLSKLVDPASRIISRSASRLFSSVFRKRLDAPLAAQEEDLQSSEEVNAMVYTNPPLGVQENGGSDAENTINSSSIDGVQQNRDFATEGIFELEQLLKKKTFTRVEFDRLTELLRSRTIGSSTLQSAIRCEKTGRANVLGKENGIGCIESNGNITNPAGKETMPEKDYASPAELAKSYMGCRPSKVPSSALSFRNQIYREDTALPNNVSNGKNGSNLSTVPQSVVCFNGIPEVLENGHVTPRPLGRSAMHRLSCSPYFKAPSSTNIKGGEPYQDVYAGPSTSSQWTPTNFMQSSGKQVRKRRNSVLDGDFGSSGPIRRIRQKSNLMSPSKDSYLLLTGNVPPISSTPLAENINQQLATSIQEPLSLDGPKDSTRNLRHVENGDNKVPSASAATIPPQASEMKRKTLQALDKLVTSPKERLSELRAIARDGLPSKLTVNMLHERALKSMEGIDSSKFFNLQGASNLNASSDSDAPKLTSSISQDQLTVEHNAPPKPAFSGVKMATETVRMVNTVTSVTDAKLGLKTVDFAISGSAAVPSPKKPAFQMTAPEDFLELDDDVDDDDYNNRDASEPFATGNDKPEPKISECKTIISERAISENSLGCSSESMLTSGSILNKEARIIASNRPVNEKDTGFSLHVPPASSISQPSSMPSPLLDKSALQKEQIAASGFIFGSKESHDFVLPTTTTRIRDSTGLTFNQRNATTTTLSEGLDSVKGGKRSKCGDISGNAASASVSTLNSPAFASFGAYTTSSLSNGLQTSTSSTYPVSTAAAAAAAAMPFSNNSASSTLSISAASITCSISPSISSAPIFSTVPSGASTVAPISVSPSKGISISRELEGMPVKASTFSTSSAIASGTPTAFSNTGSNSSVLATPSMSSSMSFSVAASSSFSSSGSSSLDLSAPSTFSNTGGSIFGFIAPSQSSSSSLSVANSNSQNSTTTFGATAGTTFGSDIIQAGNGISQFSQDTASQFGSFSSSPTFGLSGSSSLGSGSSHFGPATSEFIPFGSSSGLSPPTVVGSSTSGSSSSLEPIATASLPSPSSQIFTSTVIGSSTSLSKGFSFGQSASSSSSQASTSVFVSSTSLPSTGFSFGQSASTSSSQPSSSSVFGSSTSSPSTGFSLGQSAPISSSQPSSSSVFGSSTSSPSTGFSIGQSAPMSSSQPSSSSLFGSTTSPSTGFSFGQLPPISTAPPSTTTMGFSFGQSAPSGSSSFAFGASPGSTFSFTSAGTITSSALFSPAQPAFGLPTPAAGFSSASPGNDQMNVEDSMADDTVQAAAHMVPSFGQTANSLPTSNFTFGSPAVPSGGSSLFQFGSQQNSSVTQSPSPFQTGGNLEFSAGGSFSLGSVGGDKSGRKMVKINRNRHRKK